MDYEDIVEELKSRGNDREEPSLDPAIGALEELGRPDNDYPVVLVGGTNGKGSTVEMIYRCLEELGLDVGVYKSPHLVSVRERIRINDRMIEEKEFERLYSEIEDRDLTFFEALTVMAYRHFSIHGVDYAVMEVGMGGRLDATNAAEPSLSVITNVENDHGEYLGESIQEKAREKAGITPWNGKLVTGEKMMPVLEAADERSCEMVEPLEVEPVDGSYFVKDQEFTLPVRGNFQRDNLETALRVVDELEKLPDLKKAFEELNCPGRMELVSRQPKYIHDGAHNPSALRRIIPDLPDGFICIFSALESKPVGKMIDILEQKASKFYLARPDFHRAADPENLEKHVSVTSTVLEDPGKAVECALEEAGEDGAVVVTGSLYLVGDVKKVG